MVTLRGEIDHAVKDMLSEALPSYDGAAPLRTVVDLSGVTFMDSSGIKATSSPPTRPRVMIRDGCVSPAPRNRCYGSLRSSAWTRSSAAIPPSTRP